MSCSYSRMDVEKKQQVTWKLSKSITSNLWKNCHPHTCATRPKHQSASSEIVKSIKSDLLRSFNFLWKKSSSKKRSSGPISWVTINKWNHHLELIHKLYIHISCSFVYVTSMVFRIIDFWETSRIIPSQKKTWSTYVGPPELGKDMLCSPALTGIITFAPFQRTPQKVSGKT